MIELMRVGFTDYDAFGAGLCFAETHAGRLDAPDFMPQGSMRGDNGLLSGRRFIRASMASRDAIANRADLGAFHDAPRAA